jgi:predicted lipid-binding transport protein (Tim44 family)
MGLAAMAVAMVASLTLVDVADARRGGSFGSRGSRTWMAPAPSPTAPRSAAPLDRSMTPRTAPQAEPTIPARPGVPATVGQRPGLFGGMGGLFGALALGGLVGMLFGNGLGGLGGVLGLILQIGLLVLVVRFALGFLANRNRPATSPAGRGPSEAGSPSRSGLDATASPGPGSRPLNPAPASMPGQSAPNGLNQRDEIGVTEADLGTFERLLAKTQSAFGREDYAGLREIGTPEIVSYLSEELSQNATRGVRNEVSDIRLLQGDLAEAWRESDTDYATVAMRYESRDVMRDRQTGRVVEGDPGQATEATELWTFVRPRGSREWKLSAIQEAAAA